MEEESLVDHLPLHTTFPVNDFTGQSNVNNDSPTPPETFRSSQIPSRRDDATGTIAKVEEVFESIVDGLLQNSDELSISLKVKKSRTATRDSLERDLEPAIEFRKVTFPGRTGHEAWRFSMVLSDRYTEVF